MAADCMSSLQGGKRTQGVYNDRLPSNGRSFTNGNAAQSETGSVSEEGLGAGSTDVKYDLKNSDGSNNRNIGKIGWGA